MEKNNMTLENSVPANWCFSPVQYPDTPFLFWPVSNNGGSEVGGYCYIYVFDESIWFPDDIYGIGTEDVVKIVPWPELGRLYTVCETYDTLRVKTGPACNWVPTLKMGPKATMYGAFDGVIHKDKLYVPIAGYNRGTATRLWEHDGATWKLTPHVWQDPAGRATGWAIGADDDNLYVGIAGFARGIDDSCRYDGIWRIDRYGTRHHESPAKAQCFIRLPDNTILAGCTGGELFARRNGKWESVFSTGSTCIIELNIIGNELWIGTLWPGKLFRADLSTWNYQEVSGSWGDVARPAEYKGSPVVAWIEKQNNKAYIGDL